MSDPMEREIATALQAAGISYRVGYATKELDFHLIDFDVWIECKQFHSDRISEQMARHPNVIAIQGLGAAKAFARMLRTSHAVSELKG